MPVGSYDYTGSNFWNISKTAGANIAEGDNLGGNFWTDGAGTGYSDTCVDADHDTLCDTPLALAGTDQDALPLAVPNTAPDAPVPVYPVAGSFVNTRNPTLTWNVPADPDGNPLHFVVEVSPSADFSGAMVYRSWMDSSGFSPALPVPSGQATASLTLPTLAQDGLYYWRVAAYDGTAQGPFAAANFTADATPPAVTATPSGTLGNNGWYRSAVTVSFSGTDATSGGVTCSADQTLSSDGANQTATGTCTDAAGNSAQGSATVSIDQAGPTVTATPSGTLGNNGWYRSAVTVSFSGTDATSGGVTCSADQTLSSDGTNQTATGTCTDAAGNSAQGSATFSIDQSGPTVIATPSGTLGSNGWYRSAVTVSFSGTDATSGGVTCSADQTLSSDGANQTAIGTCSDAAGNSAQGSATVSIDQAGPTVTATPSGTLGSNGWYISNVTVSFSGTDSTSGGVTCSADQTLTSDGANQTAAGTRGVSTDI